jgi:hypothetical protein
MQRRCGNTCAALSIPLKGKAMNTINRTRISNIVKAVFFMSLDERLSDMEIVPFTPDGVFADQEYRTLVSMIYGVRFDIVRLMDGSDKPLQDEAKAGSLGTQGNGPALDFEIEREFLLHDALRCHAILERHAQTLEEKARNDSEEAGRRTNDGGRYRIARKGREFRGFLNTWDEFLLDLKSKAVAGSPWAIKIDEAEELVFPLVSAQDATDEYLKYFEVDNVTKVSHKAWDKLTDALEQYGMLLVTHDNAMCEFNELPVEFKDRAKSLVAIENSTFRQESRNSEYWVNRFLEPWALLCHTGLPKALIDSPEWRTATAHKRAAAARIKVAEITAQALELEAMNAEAEALEALAAARQRIAALSNQNVLLDKIEAKGVKSNGGVKPVGMTTGIPSYIHR